MQTPYNAPQSAGAEFDALSPEQQTAASKSLAVFARVEPLHKLRLVELLRDQVGIVQWRFFSAPSLSQALVLYLHMVCHVCFSATHAFDSTVQYSDWGQSPNLGTSQRAKGS